MSAKIHVPGPDGKCMGCAHILTTAHPYLQTWFWVKVVPRYPHIHVAWAYRGKADQDAAVNATPPKSELPWPRSPHNRRVPINPALPFDPLNEADANGRPESAALDLFEMIQGQGVWSKATFASIAAGVLYEGLPILWGGKYRTLGDSDHFQYDIPKDTYATG